jgi:hypothetical protein
MTMRLSRGVAGALAVGLVIGLPAAAYVAAPARATGGSSHAPGSRLAGINANAAATGAQVAFFAPGIVPVGNSKVGNLLQASLPYATSTGSTGPSTAGLAAPAWPGDVAANAGNSLQTFMPQIPAPLVSLLNDPIAAHSTFPAQLNTHSSGKYSPPGGAQTGIGNASTTSAKGGTTSRAEVNSTSPLGAIPGASALVKALAPILKGPIGGLLSGLGLTPKVAGVNLINLGSTTARTGATIRAASVLTSAQTRVGHVNIAGIVRIDGVSSNAFAQSDGKVGRQHSHLHVGKVTVAGVPAAIGRKGLTLRKKAFGGSSTLISTANKLLGGLRQAGITIKTIAPLVHKKKSSASVTSGAVQIEFAVKSVPNLAAQLPQLPLPLPNSAAIDIDLGLAQASADATRLPPLGPPVKSPPTTPPATTPPGPGDTTDITTPTGPAGTDSLPPADGTTSTAPTDGTPPSVAGSPAAAVFGIPTRVAWVVAAFLLSLMVAGPLLAYANWQLLRGRTS